MTTPQLADLHKLVADVPAGWCLIPPGVRVRMRPLHYYLSTGQGKPCSLELPQCYIECADAIFLGQSRMYARPAYKISPDDNHVCEGTAYLETDQGVAYLP